MACSAWVTRLYNERCCRTRRYAAQTTFFVHSRLMNRPRVYCDFNHGIDEHTFGLVKLGTKADLARLQLKPREGLEVTLYDLDTDDDGASAWLEVDAVVVHVPEVGWAAKVEPGGFRNTPRHCHSARIQWPAQQQTLGLPTVLHVVHPA